MSQTRQSANLHAPGPNVTGGQSDPTIERRKAANFPDRYGSREAPARTKGPQRSARLLLEAASNFCALARPTSRDISVFREFFTQLIDACGSSERRALAATIANNAYVPRSIVLYLALDELEVAAPILLLSPVLKEADIIALARKLVPAHLLVLCRRDDLTPSSGVSLLAHGGRNVAEQLAKNAFTAKSRPAGQAQPAPSKPVEHAQPEIAEVTERAGPTATEKKLLELAARGGRLGVNKTPRQKAPSAPQGSEPHFGQTPPPDQAPLFGAAMTQQLIHTARTGDRKAVAEQIAHQIGHPAGAVYNLLSGDAVETLCALLKGLGIDDVSASQLVLLLRPAVGRSREEMAAAVRYYRRLDEQTCRRFLETFNGGGTRDEASARTRPTDLVAAIAERRSEIANRAALRPSARLAAAAEGQPAAAAGVRKQS